MATNNKRRVALIFLVALGMRLLAVWLWKDDCQYLHRDSSEYLSLAYHLKTSQSFSFGEAHPFAADGRWNFASSGNPPAVVRAPLYPTMIALLWWTKDPPIMAVRITQAILGAVIASLTFSIALRVFDRSVATASALAMALLPLSCYLTSNIMSDILFASLIALGIWAWGERRAYLAGVCLGLATLTRPTILAILIAMWLGALLFRWRSGFYSKLVGISLLVISPWIIRDAFVTHKFVPVQTYGWGSNLLFGTLEFPAHAGNRWVRYMPYLQSEGFLNPDEDASEAEARMQRRALEIIKHNPVRWFLLRLKDYPRLFLDHGTYLYIGNAKIDALINWCSVGFSIFLPIVAFVGLCKFRRELCRFDHLLILPAGFCFFSFTGYGESRYLIPFMPSLIIFGVAYIYSLFGYKQAELDGGFPLHP